MTIYMMVKKKIAKLGEKYVDFEQLMWYTGYITAMRDGKLINKAQCAKLDLQLREAYDKI